MSANDNFDIILRRHDEIDARLTEGVAGGEYAALSRERAELDPIVGAIKAWRAKDKERSDLAALLAEPDLDAEMRAMAEAIYPSGLPSMPTRPQRSPLSTKISRPKPRGLRTRIRPTTLLGRPGSSAV